MLTVLEALSLLEFDDWLDVNHDNLYVQYAESGGFCETDRSFYDFAEIQYFHYVIENENVKKFQTC